MHANMFNMNKHDDIHTQNKMLDAKCKAIQQIKIECVSLSNTIGFQGFIFEASCRSRKSII